VLVRKGEVDGKIEGRGGWGCTEDGDVGEAVLEKEG
jgi:hypothetical protein